jgi:hypothetical protein
MVITALLAAAMAGGGYEHNHPDVVWRTLETDHFLFHWPESGKAETHPHYFTTKFSVARLAEIAEEAYPLVTGQIEYELEEKVHVVVYDQDEGWEGNGFAIAEMDWTGFAARWGPTFRMRGRMEFLEDVFVHEFAHIVSLKAYLPWSEDSVGYQTGSMIEDEEWLRRWGYKGKTGINADLGVAMPVVVHTPFWWAEGGAEYWSHKAGYNFWGNSREAFLRTSWLEGRVLDLNEWTTRADKQGFEGERGYNHGYAFGLWLADEAGGKDVFTNMAKVSAERWHFDWDNVFEEATGWTQEEAHDRWLKHLDEHYTAQLAPVRERGVVAGRELRLTEPPWEMEKGPKTWEKLDKDDKTEVMDGESAYHELPSWNAQGTYFAWFEQGLNVRKMEPNEWGAIGGDYVDRKDHKSLKQWSKRTANHGWAQYYKVGWDPSVENRFVFTGNEDWAGKALMSTGLTIDGDGYDWSQLFVGTVDDSGKQLKVDVAPIPNTLRAVEAAFSPDGNTVVFGRYGDGTHEIWRIDPDGNNAAQLTDFGDGTQVQGLEYSSDGSSVLLSLFRNYQQDIYLMDPETGELTRLTDSQADETDPHFGPGGKIWFASDLTGIYNVYSLDLEKRETQRHTDLLGSAYGSDVSPDGHLFYTAFTAHGYRLMGVNADDLKHDVVDYPGLCPDNNCPGADEAIAYRPNLVDVYAASKKYNPLKSQFRANAWPVARSTDRMVEVGSGLFLGDPVEKHYIEGEFTFGKDRFHYLSYYNETFGPSLSMGWMRYAYKGTYGYGDDLDGAPETTHDLTVRDAKFEQVSDDIWLMASYNASNNLWLGASLDGSLYQFRELGDGAGWDPYMQTGGLALFFEWSLHDPWYSGEDWINPRGSRRFYVEYALRGSRIVDPESTEALVDDGEIHSSYPWNRLTVAYTEFIPVFDRHTLQLDFEGGFIDRNVTSWDEFGAGGRHPYDWGNGTIGNNVQFSGYEGYSLTGETMLISNASYRFPLLRDLDWKLGPVYTESLWFQFFGSAGNLWSYRIEGDSHKEGFGIVADDASAIRREIPFVDYAHKNSPPGRENHILGDLGGELRIRQFIWNDYDWDSFLRVSVGLNPTAGYGDVNYDLIQNSIAQDAASELSAEVEPPTVRIYAGLGTGW